MTGKGRQAEAKAAADQEKPRPREILSKNLQALIEDAKTSRPRLAAIKKIAAASEGRLSNGKVGRIAAGSHTTDIDALNDLAAVFDLQPWQLLVENLNPKALPRLADSALLTQIKQIVDSAKAPAPNSSSSFTDEQPVQQVHRSGAPAVGPALAKAIGRGKTHAGSTAAKVQKPRSGSGRKGNPRTG